MSGSLDDIKIIQKVFGLSPTDVIREIEEEIPKVKNGGDGVALCLSKYRISDDVLDAAVRLKEVVGQINVVIHALGILVSLQHILEKGETVESISLGAGNTGKPFDLVTNCRVAEFKFIRWQGGPESIRQNGVFKDFLALLWDESGKKRQLFLNGTSEALHFLNGGRSISSILSRNVNIRTKFYDRYDNKYNKVGEFYSVYKNDVEIIDLNTLFPVSKRIFAM